jgi:hypothetical protein
MLVMLLADLSTTTHTQKPRHAPGKFTLRSKGRTLVPLMLARIPAKNVQGTMTAVFCVCVLCGVWMVSVGWMLSSDRAEL